MLLAPAAKGGRPLAGQGRVKVTADKGRSAPAVPAAPPPPRPPPPPGLRDFPGGRSRTAGRAGSPQGRRLRLQSRRPSGGSGDPTLQPGQASIVAGTMGRGCGSAWSRSQRAAGLTSSLVGRQPWGQCINSSPSLPVPSRLSRQDLLGLGGKERLLPLTPPRGDHTPCSAPPLPSAAGHLQAHYR